MRAAIIGTGGIARVHARLIRELGGELVGVCGRRLQSAQSFGAGIAYDDIERLLRDQKPDVVHVRIALPRSRPARTCSAKSPWRPAPPSAAK